MNFNKQTCFFTFVILLIVATSTIYPTDSAIVVDSGEMSHNIDSSWALKTLRKLLPADIPLDGRNRYAWGELGDPCFLDSHPVVNKWGIVSHSLDEFIKQIKGNLSNSYESFEKQFPYYDEYSLENSIFSINFTRPYFIRDMSSEQFFSRESPNFYRYYSGNVMQQTLENFAKKIFPRQLVNEDSLTVTMWMGTAGVQAPAHYDDTFNVYIQLSGSKRFRLLPHSAATSLCIHGRFHPHARQSRIADIETRKFVRKVFSNRNKDRIINDSILLSYSELCQIQTADIIEITLQPGNVLYIPPFWFHEVCYVLLIYQYKCFFLIIIIQ